MSSEFFDIEQAGDVVVVVLGQSLSTFSGEELLKERAALLEEVQGSAASAVVVDFATVEYFDSILLDTLCQMWHHLREQGQRMALCNVCDLARQVLKKCRLDTLWPIYVSRQSALDGVRSAGQGG